MRLVDVDLVKGHFPAEHDGVGEAGVREAGARRGRVDVVAEEVLLQEQDLLRHLHLRLLVQQQLEVLDALLLVEVHPVLGQPVDEEDVHLLLAQDARYFGEEPVERPHLLRVHLEQP